jgi:hypothetical protein
MAKRRARHLYRRRSREDSQSQRVLDEIQCLEMIPGRCFLVDQQSLLFARDAKTASDSRPAVIAKADGQRISGGARSSGLSRLARRTRQ